MNNSKHNAWILDSIMQPEELTRLVSFTNIGLFYLKSILTPLTCHHTDCFNMWAPRLHKYYGDMLKALCTRHPHLRHNFAEGDGVFACSTINFGPATKSFPHTNNNNLAWGWCAVTTLGDYNPTLGDHFILWDLKLIIEFPPGATVLIPSAIFKHSNTVIQDGETRYSFTQYASGGLFRWVEHGFCGEAVYNTSPSGSRRREEGGRKAGRWAKGMETYFTISELITCYNKCL